MNQSIYKCEVSHYFKGTGDFYEGYVWANNKNHARQIWFDHIKSNGISANKEDIGWIRAEELHVVKEEDTK